jgi:3D (Asp-Asp-Asp) domain-containing protein
MTNLIGILTISAYCWCSKCCGKSHRPCADGLNPSVGTTSTIPRRYPLGTKLYIEGIGWRIGHDRTSRRYDHRIDIFVRTHKEAKKFGIRKVRVWIIK